MIILPAIDILDGNCVRLAKGEYETAHKVAQDAVETAVGFEKSGAEYIHLVDLNGAKDGKTVNHELICRIASTVGIPVEIGGGIRDMKTVEFYLSNGVKRVIIGTAALKNPEFVKEAAKKFPGQIAVGIDAKNGFVSVDGWTKTSGKNYIEFAKEMESAGACDIIFTEIERDGMLCGIDTDKYKELQSAVSVPITASGGIRDINDIKSLAATGIYGAICGKSIYSGTLDLEEAIAAAKNVN